MIPTRSRRDRLAVLAFAAAVLLLPEAASAQTAGAIVAFFTANFARGIINAGIIGLAVLMLIFRFGLGTVLMVAGGGLVFANRDALSGLFGV